MAAGSLERAAWRLRSEDFGKARNYNDGRAIVAVGYEPGSKRVDDWLMLRHLWLDLPPHPQIFDALDHDGSTLLLRYAAIDWHHDPQLATAPVIATWAARLTDVFRLILRNVPTGEAGRFLRPVLKIDLVNDVRVAFLPVKPGECNDQTVMRAITATIRDYVGVSGVAKIAPILTGKYQTLDDFHAALDRIALPNLDGDRLVAWQHAQEGVGWLEVGQLRTALHSFRSAVRLNPRLRVAEEGRHHTLVMLGEPTTDAAERPRAAARRTWQEHTLVMLGEPTTDAAERPRAAARRTWQEIASEGQRLEAGHQFVEALALYRSPMDGADAAALDLAIARCSLALGDCGLAIDYAARALALEPRNLGALFVQARGLMLAHRYADALRVANDWLAIEPDDAGASYARGRALFALGRFVEAREAFDRACLLRPQMLEAMLMRREVDRVAKTVTKQAGTSKPMTIDVPEHLAELREALANGRVQHVIAVLERPEYDDDSIAKLVHADCLAFEQRYDEALAIYDRAARAPELQQKALIGKIHALLGLERAAEAIAELDRARDVGIDVVELRALALRRLGLADDADREFDRVIATSASRSNLRVGR